MKKTALNTCLASLIGIVGLAALAPMSGCGSEGTSTSSDKDGGAEEVTGTIAEMVSVNQIAVYQGTKAILVDDGAPALANAPVVPGRPGLVRVHARSKLPKAKQALMNAELRIKAPNKPDLVLTDGPRSIVALDDAILHTTFNFEVAAENIVADATVSVELRAAEGDDTTVVRYPHEGEPPVTMRVGPLAPTLKVKFVPVKYEADGSGRLPKLDASVIEAYRKSLYKMYPATVVEVTVREEPLRWPLEVEANGDGWGTLLDAVVETRTDDRAPDDVYYVGVFSPAPTQSEYCRGGGCVLGIAPQSLVSDTGMRVAMILGYATEHSHGTLAQELAHAMGRDHAPCGNPGAVDPKYPYGRANIGVNGYDILEKKIIDSESRVFDFMSYCSPVWISDYTWKGLYERMIVVEETKRSPEAIGADAPNPQNAWHVGKDGALKKMPKISLSPNAPSGFRPIAGLPGSGYIVAPSKSEALVIRDKVVRASSTQR